MSTTAIYDANGKMLPEVYTIRHNAIVEQAAAWARDCHWPTVCPYIFRDAHPGSPNAPGLDPNRYTIDQLREDSGWTSAEYIAWRDDPNAEWGEGEEWDGKLSDEDAHRYCGIDDAPSLEELGIDPADLPDMDEWFGPHDGESDA